VLFALSLASEILLVATPEPTSLTDAYATIKVLATQQHRQLVRLIVNQAARPGDGRAITAQLQVTGPGVTRSVGGGANRRASRRHGVALARARMMR
jgi:flagellar biosynthesis protein FlhG